MTYRLCRRCRSAVAMAWSLRSVSSWSTMAFCHTRVVPAGGSSPRSESVGTRGSRGHSHSLHQI